MNEALKHRRKSPKAFVKRPGWTRGLSAAVFGAAAAVENRRPRQPSRMHEPGALPAPAVLQGDHSQAPNTLPVFGGLAAPALCRARRKRTRKDHSSQNPPWLWYGTRHGAGSRGRTLWGQPLPCSPLSEGRPRGGKQSRAKSSPLDDTYQSSVVATGQDEPGHGVWEGRRRAAPREEGWGQQW